MASDGSDLDARYALSNLLQRGTVAEYESEFLMLIKRVTMISESLLKSFYISGLKPLLQCALLRLAPTTLREAFSIARIMKARFETIIGKKLNIEKKIDIVLTWPSEEASLVIKGMKVRSEFSEISENKKSVEEVVVGGGKTCGVGEDELNRVISALMDEGGEFDGRLDEINLNLSKELADNGRKAEEWCCVMSKVVEGGRGKKVLVAVAEGRRTTGVEDGTAVGLGYGIPESRYILDITLRTREKVPSHLGNAREDVELEARSES
uniref:Retrotransposon gag domain-containing protein n=1 Tax=Tanacetum cinerariifolium TaxID=118510 RepID=A0A6L2J574_TANCI|nr:hypothetical protein [Tanacetum cinerariifolium]